jgi:ribonuclease MRP protein subunit RMP1
MENNPITTISTLPPLKLPSTSQQADLHHLSSLLHLIHHRNHNQHRRSTWYRHFNLFRRHLSTFLTHLSTLTQTPTTNLARHKKKAQDAKLQLQLQQTLCFWRDVLVPKASHAFGQVVANERFAVLGVVLMAVLCSVCRILGLVNVYEEVGEEETRRVLEAFAEESWRLDGDGVLGIPVPRQEDADDKREDIGRVIARHDAEDGRRESDFARATEQTLAQMQSRCLARDGEILEQSRQALKSMAAVPSASLTPLPSLNSKKLKTANPSVSKKKPITTLAAVNYDDNSTKPSKGTSAMASTSLSSLPSPPSARPTVKTKTSKLKDDETTATIKPAKKKRKKNAIDDLFAGW